jgi:pyruvate dehydrogenase E1 component alpha subunit
MAIAEKAAPKLSADKQVDMLRQMMTIRRFDSRVLEIYREGVMRGTSHPYIGMEAVAVGACAALRQDDYITSTHRGHGHCIAKGGDIKLMMAELLGKATGYCKGKGGSMHIADVERGILGANGIVGGGMGIATGSALSAKVKGTDQVTLCFFGDGALNQGILHECSNLAAIWKLPVVFLCENNQYAMSARADVFTSVPDPSVRAEAYGFPGVRIDGMDVLGVYEAVCEAVDRARRNEGPSLIVATTYRYFGHHVGDPLNYRTKEEVDEWRKQDPIERFRARLLDERAIDESRVQELEEQVNGAVEEAIEFAKNSPEPSVEILMEDIYA